MIVDDDPGTLRLLDRMLKCDKFIIVKIDRALAALDMLEELTPDLFILDVMMPGMNGIALCKSIRQRPQTAQTPIIMLSARADIESMEQAFEAGANDFVAKPILHHDLRVKVSAILGMHNGNSSQPSDTGG